MLYRLENLKRWHGTRTVLNIDKLEIGPNRIYTLIGPNGAGKTSLLKILAALSWKADDHERSGLIAPERALDAGINIVKIIVQVNIMRNCKISWRPANIYPCIRI